VFLPVYAALADAFGRHWALQTSLVWFLFGSALSTGAKNMEMMLAGRGIAGIGAAGSLSVRASLVLDRILIYALVGRKNYPRRL
jgi:MFS family permease